MAGSDVRLRVTIFADGRTAVRAFGQVAEASEATGDRVEKDAKRQKESFALVESGAGRLKGSIANLAGSTGFIGLGFGIKDLVEAGQRWQVQQAQLGNAMKVTGNATAASIAQVTTAAEKLARSGGYGVPQQLSGLNQFIRLTHSSSAALRDNKIATDLARSGATTFSNAQTVIERALSGSTRGLQKYLGIIEPVKTAEFNLSQAHDVNIFKLDAQSKALGKLGPLWLKQQEILHHLTPAEVEHAQTLDKQATATEALTRLQAKYAGSTAAFSRTTAGQMSNAENSLDIAIEKIGKSFLKPIAALATGIARMATVVSDNWKQIEKVIKTGVEPIVATVRGLVDLLEKSKTARTVLMGLAGALLFMGAQAKATAAYNFLFVGSEEQAAFATRAWAFSMDALPIFAVITGLILLYEHSKTFRDIIHSLPSVLAAAFRWVEGAVGSVVQFIGRHWKMLAVGGAFFLGGPFLALPVFIATHFNQVKKIVTDVVNFIWSKFKWVVDQVKGFVSGIAHVPGNIAGSVGHFLSHPFGLHTGGIVPHMASGGVLGGYGGGDSIPAMLEPGEGVLRKEAVQSIGSQTFNSINATGTVAGAGAPPDYVYVAAPVNIQAGQRVIAETTAHFVARKSALSGRYVSG